MWRGGTKWIVLSIGDFKTFERPDSLKLMCFSKVVRDLSLWTFIGCFHFENISTTFFVFLSRSTITKFVAFGFSIRNLRLCASQLVKVFYGKRPAHWKWFLRIVVLEWIERTVCLFVCLLCTTTNCQNPSPMNLNSNFNEKYEYLESMQDIWLLWREALNTWDLFQIFVENAVCTWLIWISHTKISINEIKCWKN